jgi:glycosyltransferase involved in cell wall biosynthesis
MNITVLTPTIGTPDLERCVNSVSRQTINSKHNVRHLVIADGKQHLADVTKYAMKGWLGEGLTPRIYAVPDNTGGGGWYGHRIYAFYSQLIECDYLLLLDEDNTYEPNHIESLIPIAAKHGFAWTKRKVYTKEGEYLGVDQQESIGVQLNGAGYALVDTSAWCFRADNIHMLTNICGQWGADRQLTRAMLDKHGSLVQAQSDYATMNYYTPDNLIDHFKNICIP